MKQTKTNKLWVSVFSSAEMYDGTLLPEHIETRILYENGNVYGADNLREKFLTQDDFIKFLHTIPTIPQGTWPPVHWKHDTVVDTK